MRALCAALVLLLGACGEDEAEAGALRGSVSRIYGLGHDGVRARLSNSELAIQYTAGREVPVQVVVDLTAMPLDGPASVDLAAAGDVLGRRGDARLPDLKTGTLTLDAYAPEAGARVAGSFEAVVTAKGDDYTLVGSFDAPLEDLR